MKRTYIKRYKKGTSMNKVMQDNIDAFNRINNMTIQEAERSAYPFMYDKNMTQNFNMNINAIWQ